MLNSRAGYEADVTVTRTGDDAFLMVSSAATTVRDLDWLRRNAPASTAWHVEDVTDALAVIGVMGPRSRDLLATCSPDDLSDNAFPFGTSQGIRLAGVTVRATRITYVGELGWEVYVPTGDAPAVYAALTAAGEALGARPAGYYAIDALRLEKGYRAFARELTPDLTPVEAGLLFACKLRTDIDFLGRSALEARRAAGPRRRVVSFTAGEGTAYLWGGELVRRDGEPVGQVTSAAWGASVGSAVGLALIGPGGEAMARTEWIQAGRYDVDLAGRRVPISVSLRAPYDPDGHKVRPDEGEGRR